MMVGMGMALTLPRGGSATFSPSKWFLYTGVWSGSGQWLDGIAWPVPWFLSTGRWAKAGRWADSEVWA